MFENAREFEQFPPAPRRRRWGIPLCLMAVIAAAVIIFSGREPSEQEAAAPTLPEQDREFLWDAEHHGLLLTQFGWKPLVTALAEGNGDAVNEHLESSFVGRIPEEFHLQRIHAGGLEATRGTGSETSRSVQRAGFVDWLLEARRDFAEDPAGRFKITAIRPVDRAHVSGDWMGSGRVTLEGRSQSGGPRFTNIELTFRTVQPAEATLNSGGWLRGCAVERIDRGASSEPLMREAAAQRGLEPDRLHDNWESERKPVNTGGIYCCDYNRDGCVDVLVTDMYDHRGLILYRGSPQGRFDEVSEEVGLPVVQYAVDAIFADLDGDGWEDLIVPGKLVLRNHGGREFVDVTDESNLDDLIYALGREGGLDAISGVSVADFDLDGRMDLYVTRADVTHYDVGSWIDGSSGDRYGNQLLRNAGAWMFQDRTRSLNADGDARSTFTSVWLHANDDSYPDVYVIHEFGPGALLVNHRGQYFKAVDVAAESSDFGSMGLTCGDVDNDGLVDLYVSNMYSSAGNRVMDNLPPGFYDETTMGKLRRMVAGNQLHRNLGGLEFDTVADAWGIQQVGWGWGPTLADLNNDGWLDIYATCGFMSRDRHKPDG